MEEALLYVKKSLEELEKVTIYDLPKVLRNDIITALTLLSSVSIKLEFKEVDKK